MGVKGIHNVLLLSKIHISGTIISLENTAGLLTSIYSYKVVIAVIFQLKFLILFQNYGPVSCIDNYSKHAFMGGPFPFIRSVRFSLF